MSAWQNDYLQGTGCEMYTETLSPSFTTMSFAMAAEWVHSPVTRHPSLSTGRLCFVKLKLLLLAVEETTSEGQDNQISINPRDFKISPNTVGFFIAQSAEEVKRCEAIMNWKLMRNMILFVVLDGSTIYVLYKWDDKKNAKKMQSHYHPNTAKYFQVEILNKKCPAWPCRAWWWCRACHEKVRTETSIRRCKCRAGEDSPH